jgi:hypothetical protein
MLEFKKDFREEKLTGWDILEYCLVAVLVIGVILYFLYMLLEVS